MNEIRKDTERARAPRIRCGVSLAGATLLVTGCVRDSRNVQAHDASPAVRPTEEGRSAQSWPICSLVGHTDREIGVFGTDLGYSVRQPSDQGPGDRLVMLFGDTLSSAGDACKYPVFGNDDLQGWLPAVRPPMLNVGAPTKEASKACDTLDLGYSNPEDPTTWHRIRLFKSPDASSHDAPLDTGLLRTPVGVFSDGKAVFGFFYRGMPVACENTSECPADMACTADSKYRGKTIGRCDQPVPVNSDPSPDLCRDDSDCGPLIACHKSDSGVCVASRPFEIQTANQGALAPKWYDDDPRRGAAMVIELGVARWPSRPTDYAIVEHFVTNRFVNMVARTVARFDPEHPEKNDYRPGHHTLLVWGRPAFFEKGGAQSLPFLLYQPLDELNAKNPFEVQWSPRFFAGYGPSGKPRWSKHEEEAKPVYGGDPHVTASGKLEWEEPEFDYVNQMTVSWVEPLKKWVMLYGGDVPSYMLKNPSDNTVVEPTHLQRSPGAIYMRSAAHPWGRASWPAPRRQAWSSPEPVLTRNEAAPFLVCGDGGEKELPGCMKAADTPTFPKLLSTIAKMSSKVSAGRLLDITGSCLGGDFAMTAARGSGNPLGRLYAPNVLDDWTADVTDKVDGLGPKERAAEIYWNVSTFNPYRVMLFKTQLRGVPGD